MSRGSIVVLAVGLLLFGPALALDPRYKTGDFGPHHVLTRALLRGFEAGHVPRYMIGVSTGDSPFETYPVPTYALAAALSWLLGGLERVPLALACLAAGLHITMALLVARLASRFAPTVVAIGVGLATLFDAGGFGTGGARSIMEAGLLHGALAQCLCLVACDGVIDLMRSGVRARTVAQIALAAALAAATHPASMLFLAALAAALVVCLSAARQTRPRPVIAGGVALGLGIAAAATVWASFAERTFAYGLHFGYPGTPLFEAVADLAAARWPPTSFPLFLASGYVGVLWGFGTRRPVGMLLATLTTLLWLASTDLVQLGLFDLFPRAMSRLQCFRFMTLAHPLLAACAALPLAGLWRAIVASGARREVLANMTLAAGFVLCIAAQNGELPASVSTLRGLLTEGVPDRQGFEALTRWAVEQEERTGARRIGRLMWEGSDNFVSHVTAAGGPPAFFVGDGVGMLLRERIADRDPESLRRFNVRFVASRGQPLRLGAPGTERQFGSYRVRELPDWDGRLARVEAGAGEVTVASRGDERVEIVLSGTDEPALVALGIGYYPRWRARAGDGRPLSVYAWPATHSYGSPRVVAAWLPPGRSTFVADGALPSDGSGAPTSAAAVACLLALPLLARALRSRRRRKHIVAFSRRHRLRRLAQLASVLAAGTLLLAAGRSLGAASLRLGSGFALRASVQARTPETRWVDCAPRPLRRSFSCPGLGQIGDSLAFILSDHPSSTPFVTPGIVARPEQSRVEYRVTLRRELMGRYVGRAWGAGGTALRCAGGDEVELGPHRVELEFAPASVECELRLRTRGGRTQGVTLVRTDALDLDRTRDVPWAPAEPPAELRRRTPASASGAARP